MNVYNEHSRLCQFLTSPQPGWAGSKLGMSVPLRRAEGMDLRVPYRRPDAFEHTPVPRPIDFSRAFVDKIVLKRNAHRVTGGVGVPERRSAMNCLPERR